MRTKRYVIVILFIVLISSIASFPHSTIRAAGAVGTGTPASCTEAALNRALAGGGTINFNCGSGLVTIPITTTKVIRSDTIIQGGGKITLRGNHTSRLFTVNPNVSLLIIGVTLSNGSSNSGGAILNNGTLVIASSTLSGNTANTGGAIYHDSPKTLIISDSTFATNSGHDGGGAIMASPSSKFYIVKSNFTLNSITTGLGAAINGNGTIDDSTFGLNTGGELGTVNIGNGTVAADDNLRVLRSIFTFNVVNGVGGGIYLAGDTYRASIIQSQFTQNTAHGGGGGMYIGSTIPSGRITPPDVQIDHSRFERNRGYLTGGAIRIDFLPEIPGHVSITSSQFIGNTAIDDDETTDEFGGGIALSSGDLEVEKSTFSRNRSFNGGGIGRNANGLLQINNSTFDSNTADAGGGLYAWGDVSVNQSTFYANQATFRGGGIFVDGDPTHPLPNDEFPVRLKNITVVNNTNYGIATWGGVVNMKGTLLANNTLGNCGALIRGSIVSEVSPPSSANPYVLGSMEYPGNTCDGIMFTGVDPMLGTFGNHGGETNTIDLLSGSPAIDKIFPGPSDSDFDQRGISRPQDGNGDGMAIGDIGAFEYINPSDDLGSTSSPLTEICKSFAAALPPDSGSDSMVTFNWKANPATSYQLHLYDAAHKLVNTYNLSAGVTSSSIDIKVIDSGATFFVQFQALHGQDVLCTNEVQLTRQFALPPTFQPPTNTPKP